MTTQNRVSLKMRGYASAFFAALVHMPHYSAMLSGALEDSLKIVCTCRCAVNVKVGPLFTYATLAKRLACLRDGRVYEHLFIGPVADRPFLARLCLVLKVGMDIADPDF